MKSSNCLFVVAANLSNVTWLRETIETKEYLWVKAISILRWRNISLSQSEQTSVTITTMDATKLDWEFFHGWEFFYVYGNLSYYDFNFERYYNYFYLKEHC